jgi:hypothetical protein
MMDYDIQQFMKHCKESCDNLSENDNIGNDKVDSISSSDEEIEVDEEEDNIEGDWNEKESKMIDDSLLLPFGRPSEVGSSLVDALACQIEKRGVFTQKRLNTKGKKARRKFMKKLKIAPAEGNKPQNWLSDIHLEEKAFPHLFPSGLLIIWQTLFYFS